MSELRVHPFVDAGNGRCATCGKTQPFPGYPGASDWVHDTENAQMSSYHFDPHDWRHKLPKGVKFYDFGGGIYQAPMTKPDGTYLTASLIALAQDPAPYVRGGGRANLLPGPSLKIIAFAIPHLMIVGKNSDWGWIVDKMVERWNKGIEPTTHGGAIPIEDLFVEDSPSGPRPAEQSGPDAS